MKCDRFLDNLDDINSMEGRAVGSAPDNYGTLLPVLEAWHGHDDWGMCSIYLGSIVDRVNDLRAGDNAEVLMEHAGHVLTDCLRARCDLHIPHNITADERLSASLKRLVEAL